MERTAHPIPPVLATALSAGLAAAAHAQTIRVLPPAAGHAASFAAGISADGNLVAGCSGGTAFSSFPAVWTRDPGSGEWSVRVLPTPVVGGGAAAYGVALAASATWGSTNPGRVVGHYDAPSTIFGPIAWSAPQGAGGAWTDAPLPLPPTTIYDARAVAISATGDVAIGWAQTSGIAGIVGVRWQGSVIARTVDQFTPGTISADGSAALGVSRPAVGQILRLARWDAAGALTPLADFNLPAGWAAMVRAATPDNSAAACAAWNAANSRGLRWDSATGFTDLGWFQGSTWTEPACISGDGRIIGGTAQANFGQAGTPYAGFVWTPEHGLEALGSWLQARGVDTTGWHFESLAAMTPDARTLVGYGIFNDTHRGFIVTLPEPPPGGCYANCDASTAAPVLNVADFTCFLQRFAAGDTYANCDNSTTAPTLNVADFTCFLQSFAAGCP